MPPMMLSARMTIEGSSAAPPVMSSSMPSVVLVAK